MNRILRVLAFVLVTGASVGGGNTANAATYVYDSAIGLPYLGFGYDSRKIHFQKVPISMIAAVIPSSDTYAFHGPNGQSDSKPLDLNGLPFWIYAEYSDSGSKCQYDMIEGLGPDPVRPLPEVGSIRVIAYPVDSAVVRNCGRGFERVSLEGYVSIYDEDFRKMHPSFSDEVRKGLMRDYVQRLLHSFGGKAGLQNKLDESFKSRPYHIMESLASALAAAGIRVQ